LLAIFEGLPVEGEALLAVGALLLLVEAALGLVAQPFAAEHLVEERRQVQVAALVFDVGGGVADNVAEHVEADEVAQAEGAGLGPSDGGAGEGVDFFDAEVHLLHDAHDVEHGEGADTVGDEVGSVFRVHHTLAEVEVAEVGDLLHRGRIGVLCRNDFEQAHIARRIEEVGAEPGAAEVVGEAFGDRGDGQAAGVGGDDGAGLANGFDLAQKFALEVEVFDDSFDDPVDFGELLEVVFEVADGDQAVERRLHESGGFGLDRSFFAGSGELVARGTVGVRGDDVEQVRGNTGVGQVRGDAGAHGARAQDCDLIDAFLHGYSSAPKFCPAEYGRIEPALTWTRCLLLEIYELRLCDVANSG